MRQLNILTDRFPDNKGPLEITDHCGDTIYISVPGVAHATINTYHGRPSVGLGHCTKDGEFTMDSAAELVTEYLIQECNNAIVKAEAAKRALGTLCYSQHRKWLR